MVWLSFLIGLVTGVFGVSLAITVYYTVSSNTPTPRRPGPRCKLHGYDCPSTDGVLMMHSHASEAEKAEYICDDYCRIGACGQKHPKA